MRQPINEFIDEIAEAPVAAVDGVLRSLPEGFYADVCCVTEYEFFRRYSRNELPALERYSTGQFVSRLTSIMGDASGQTPCLSLQAIDSDAIAIPAALGGNPGWVAYKKRAEASARSVGFSDVVAAGLAGAIHEMADNIVQHSQAAASGVTTFRAYDRTFEYAVADAGVGILASLRQSSEFQRLRDDIEALSLAVLPGVSRFGRESGRGYGFRAVFLPLKGASGSVRLRSGRAVLNLTGVNISADRGQCAQRSNHQGVVVSVRITAND